MSVQNLIGGKNFSEVVGKLFTGTPVEKVLAGLTAKAGIAKVGEIHENSGIKR
jgi:hypothetical protein